MTMVRGFHSSMTHALVVSMYILPSDILCLKNNTSCWANRHFWLHIKPILPQNIKNTLQMIHVLFEAHTIHNYMIQINHHKFVKEWTKYWVHKGAESYQSISEAKWNKRNSYNLQCITHIVFTKSRFVIRTCQYLDIKSNFKNYLT